MWATATTRHGRCSRRARLFFCFLAGALFLGHLGPGAFLTLAFFALLGLGLGTATITFLGTGLFLGLSTGGILGFSRLGRLNSFQPAIHLRIRNPGRTFRRITYLCTRTSGARGFSGTRLGHHNALALGFNHDVLGASVAKALLYVARTCASAQTQCLLAVIIAHLSSFSFPVAPATVVRLTHAL